MIQMPTVTAEIAFTGASTGTWLHLDDPTRGRLDVNTLGDGSAVSPIWTDVTPYQTEGQTTIRRGSSRVDSPILQYDPGTLSMPLADPDRRFDPSNLAGPYVDPVTGKTRVTAMRAVRVRASWASVDYELWRGVADDFTSVWYDPGHCVTTLTATDAFKVFQGINRAAGALVGAGETSGARVNRILDAASWPAGDRLISDGNTTVQETDLSGDVLSQLRQVADTEIGELYVDGGGRLVFRNRLALMQDTRSNTSQATFGDSGTELPYTDLQQATDDATFYNKTRVTRAGGTEQTAQDTASQALFYERTYVPSTQPILETDAAALTYAQWLLAVSSEPEIRFTSMTIEPASDPANLWPQALGRQIGDRITIRRRPPGGGSLIERDCFIRGIEHRFGNEEWSTVWALQDATRYGGFLVLDHPTLGRLDIGRLAA